MSTEQEAVITTVYSPDDGGYYATVSNWPANQYVGDTRVYVSRAKAEAAGRRLAGWRGLTVIVVIAH